MDSSPQCRHCAGSAEIACSAARQRIGSSGKSVRQVGHEEVSQRTEHEEQHGEHKGSTETSIPKRECEDAKPHPEKSKGQKAYQLSTIIAIFPLGKAEAENGRLRY